MPPPRPPLYRNLGPISRPSGHSERERLCLNAKFGPFSLVGALRRAFVPHPAQHRPSPGRDCHVLQVIATLIRVAPMAAVLQTAGCGRGSPRTTPASPPPRPTFLSDAAGRNVAGFVGAHPGRHQYVCGGFGMVCLRLGEHTTVATVTTVTNRPGAIVKAVFRVTV